MFPAVSNPNSLRLRPPPPAFHSSTGALPSPTSPNIRSSHQSPLTATATATATAYASAESTCVSPPPPLPPSLYEILGISMGASGSEIKSAYRKLARTVHPDVADTSSAGEFMKIHAAYSTLSDPEKRANYDRRLFRTHRSRTYSGGITTSPASYNRFNGYGSRNWETDQCW